MLDIYELDKTQLSDEEIADSFDKPKGKRGPKVGVHQHSHCINGHEFTPDNIYIVSGRRRCRKCNDERTRAWRAAKALTKVVMDSNG